MRPYKPLDARSEHPLHNSQRKAAAIGGRFYATGKEASINSFKRLPRRGVNLTRRLTIPAPATQKQSGQP